MLKNLFTKRDKVLNLRDVVNYSRSETLDDLPDRFAKVIEQYDSLDVQVGFRKDVYNVLLGAVEIAESMVDPTFSVETAGEKIALQMEIMARALRYLANRPSAAGFSIMVPERGQLVGHFTTREEAEDYRRKLVSFGASSKCQVVPTKVLSQHAIQPRNIPQHTFDDFGPAAPTDLPSVLRRETGIPASPLDLPPPADPASSTNAATLQQQIEKLQQGSGPTLNEPPKFDSTAAIDRLEREAEALINKAKPT